MKSTLKKTLLASSVALSLGVPCAQAALVTNVLGAYDWSTDSANFTFLSTNGGNVGMGANDVVMNWDGNAYNSSSDYTGPGSASNVTLSSTAPFFGHSWAAHDIQVFVPGSYSFDVTPGGGNTEIGMMNVTVGAGQLGMHLLWDWNWNYNIDVFVVLAQNSVFGSGLLSNTVKNFNGELTCSAAYTGSITKNCLYDGPNYGSAGAPVKNQLWMLAATDSDGDGIVGNPMAVAGPLAGMNITYSANLTPVVCDFDCPPPVPVPAAVWLFSSGLMGLVAAARYRKKIQGDTM